MKKLTLIILVAVAVLLMPREALAKGEGLVTVTTVVFGDNDGNGMPGVGEKGIAGVNVCFTPNKMASKCVKTDAAGRATAQLPAGPVQIQVQPGMFISPFVCGNTKPSRANAGCSLNTTLSSNNPILLTWIGVTTVKSLPGQRSTR